LWTIECQNTFEILKENLSLALILRGSNWDLPFHIHTNDLEKALDDVLGQQEDVEKYSICYIIKNLS
jgi:hypothetical protein